MPTLTPESVSRLLEPYLGEAAVPSGIFPQLVVYLDVILKWNARINLTAIRDPEEIVRRHFGESLFAGLHLNFSPSGPDQLDPANPKPCDSLLDLGSGAGFPGIPIQILYPSLPVTLAESRSRKVAFLREALRSLELKTEIWPGRAEAMPESIISHTVTLRAVDEMNAAVAEASRRADRQIVILGTRGAAYPSLSSGFRLEDPISLPNSGNGVVWIARRPQNGKRD